MQEKPPQSPLLKPDVFNTDGNFLRSILITAVVFVGMAGLVATGVYLASDLPTNQWDTLLQEGGIVESVSLGLYLITGFALLATGVQRWIRRSNLAQNGSTPTTCMGPMHPWFLAALVFCFAARELDFQKRFTGISVLKTRYYVSSEIGIFEKLIAFIVLATLALMVIHLFKIYHQKIITRFKNGHLAGMLPVLAVLLVTLSKGLDTGIGSLSRNGVIQLASSQKKGVMAGEEMSEVLIPLVFLSMFIVSLLPKIKSRKTDAATVDYVADKDNAAAQDSGALVKAA